MRVSSTIFLAFVVLVSFSLRSSGLPLPEQSQNAFVGIEAAPLEAEDDPARLRRYQSYGLKQTKLQGVVQPASNVHPDAAAFLNTAGTVQMSAPAEAAHSNTDAGLYGGMRRTGKTSEAPIGEEARSQTEGMVGFSDRATNQYGPTHFGRYVSDTTRVVGSGEHGMAVPDTVSQTAQGSRGFALSGGINASSRVGLETTALVDYATRESEANRGPGVASSPFGAGAGSTNLAEMGVVRQTTSEPERQGAQGAYAAVGNMGGSTLAQSNPVYKGEKRPSLPLVARVDENGMSTLSQRTTALGTSSGSRASGLYAEHQGPSMYSGSGGPAAYASEA